MQYFGSGIIQISTGCVIYPNVSLVDIWPFGHKIFHRPRKSKISMEQRVIKGKIRLTDGRLISDCSNGKKNSMQSCGFFENNFFFLRQHMYSAYGLNHVFYAPNFNLIEVPSLKNNFIILNCRSTVSLELISLIIICSVF